MITVSDKTLKTRTTSEIPLPLSGANLKDAEDVQQLVSLAKVSDVIIENFRPGVFNCLGLEFEQLSAINDKLVYCSISGYGQTDTYIELPAYRQPPELDAHHKEVADSWCQILTSTPHD